MPSKERITRMKEETRCNILAAALGIVKEEGWQALSLRKIADKIDYTAPIIYEYFDNKEGILLELTRQGYKMLYNRMVAAKSQHSSPELQMEAMWMAYWDFAFEEKEYYQVMYGVEMNCCLCINEAEWPSTLFNHVIRDMIRDRTPTDDEICKWYYTYWSVVHGLVSINIVRRGATDEINMYVLKNAISGISRAIIANTAVI